jgi:hypothetical protein
MRFTREVLTARKIANARTLQVQPAQEIEAIYLNASTTNIVPWECTKSEVASAKEKSFALT